MDVLQAWLIVGVPGLVIAFSLFTGRSKLRAWIGYAVLAVLAAFFVLVAGEVISAAFIGLAAVVFVATGRGTHTDEDFREHHQDRKRFTVADRDTEDAPAS